METFVCVIFIILFSNLQTVRTAETRKFKNSKVVIENDNVTMITDTDKVSFFIIGDWGGLPVFPYKTLIEHHLSNQMEKLSRVYNTKFQIGLGDNFYLFGVKDVNDKRFKRTFEKVFNGDNLVNSPWYFLLGNHDHYGNAKAQIEYTKKSKRWILPDYNYKIEVKGDKNDKEPLMTILMLDTIIMCGNNELGSSKQPELFTSEAIAKSNDYFIAFEQRLSEISASRVKYILVAGHFPVWSIGKHVPTNCLVNKLRPLLHKYNVSVYLAGHDHNVQHITDTFMNQTVEYIVSGSSAFCESSKKHADDVPIRSLKFHWVDSWKIMNGAFVLAETDSENMFLTFFETNGKSLYRTKIKSRF